MITVGGVVARSNGACSSPSSLISSSLTILITCCPGVRLPSTSAPSERALTALTNSFTTARLTSASIKARRTSRIASSRSFSVSRPRFPRRWNSPCNRSLKLSNIDVS